jgi:hypothetical protein
MSPASGEGLWAATSSLSLSLLERGGWVNRRRFMKIDPPPGPISVNPLR